MSRDELFARRVPRPNNDHQAIPMDSFFDDERDKISRIGSSIDDMLLQGSESLRSLRNQKSVMASVTSKIHDMANTLGLSQTVMRLTETRASSDKLILFVGMFVFTLFMFLFWRYFL